jgi:hypothetical protein
MPEANTLIEWVKNNLVKDFRIAPTRSRNYYHLGRSFNFSPDFVIPIGAADSIRYVGVENGGTNDRDLIQYLSMFNEFDLEDDDLRNKILQVPGGNPSQYFSPELIMYEFKKRPGAEVLFGGYDGAFAAGNTVLELGPGRAVGLMQLAERHPQTSFIGVDILYDKKNKVYPGKPGLQLTKDNWVDLKQIPNGSVDTIISYQALGMWGLPEILEDDDLEEISVKKASLGKIGATLTRVVKKNGTIWMDGNVNKLKELEDILDPKIWECHIQESGFNFVAKKLI